MDVFTENLEIRFADIDRSNTLTLSSTFEYFQEAAMSHAEILGCGRDAMIKNGQGWILSRLSVFVERRPRFGEKVTIRTWPRGSHKLFAIRDYDILDSEDKPVVRGRSGWLVIDLEKRRPLRPQSLVEKLPANEGLNALPAEAGPGAAPEAPAGLAARDELFAAEGIVSVSGGPGPSAAPAERALAEQGSLPDCPRRRVCYSDIDYNGHMNNTRYIQWIQDIIEPEILETAGQIRLDINYISELHYGQTAALLSAPISPCVGPADSFESEAFPARPSAAFAVEGRREEGPSWQSVFRAELRTGR